VYLLLRFLLSVNHGIKSGNKYVWVTFSYFLLEFVSVSKPSTVL
jgi:hypothetical protein